MLSFWYIQLALFVLSALVKVSRKNIDHKLSYKHLCTLR